MKIELRGMFGRCATGMALLALTAIGGGGWAVSAESADRAQRIISGWPQPSRIVARAMIERHGQPQRRDAESLTWFGLYRGKRTVVHRSDTPDGVVEQVVIYRVPEEKAAELARFDERLKTDPETSELSARTESVRTSFLVLNLAHEVASGFRGVDDAKQFRDRQIRLANAGKSSRYRESLLFEQPLPVVVPGGEETAPTGRPLEAH